MRKNQIFLIIAILLSISLPLCAQNNPAERNLFSPSASQRFFNIAHEFTSAEYAVTQSQAQQGITFLIAAKNLGYKESYILKDMVKLASQLPNQDYSAMIRELLIDYANESADLQTATEAVKYLLDQKNSREERELFLAEMVDIIGEKNTGLASELLTSLGLLMAEKGELQSAAHFFMQAYEKNKYNRLAFTKLAEVAGDQFGPEIYLENLRLFLGENPLDLDAALSFAQYAYRLELYEISATAYKYCSQLFTYLYPGENLPAEIYIPWALSNYHTPRQRQLCFQIADDVRQTGRNDLYLEAIAAKVAAVTGNTKQAEQIFSRVEQLAEKLLADARSDMPDDVGPEQLAWFYCFTESEPENALDWANRAYSTDTNSPPAAALLAYALVKNDQFDLAKSIIDGYEKNPISDLALAYIQSSLEQKDSAIETLKSVIDAEPGSLEAEIARKILIESGGEYVRAVDPNLVLAPIRDRFGRAIIPEFMNPDKIISIRLNLRGTKFAYNSDFGASLAITNNSFEPLVISDNGLFKGNIRIDADITGDLNINVPNLVSTKIKPASPIDHGRVVIVPIQLNTGRLKNILIAHPQASFEIEFVAFIDPVQTSDGQVTNTLKDIKPATTKVERPAVKLTREYLQNRINSVSRDRPGPKIKTLQFFVGLLKEQQVMANREPLYKFAYKDWMPTLLKSTIAHNLSGDDWVAKVQIMAQLISLPLDYEIINALSGNLNDSYWPVRMIALYTLAKQQDANFHRVLDWAAKNDANEYVRNIAAALAPTTEPRP